MRLKTRYRAFKDGGRVAEDTVTADVPAPQSSDEPTLALKAQIAALRLAEAGAPGAHQRPSEDALNARRVQQVAEWIQHGVPDHDVRFLSDHPEMIDQPGVLNAAAKQAMAAGHERSSPEYFEALQDNFHRLVSAPAPTAVDRASEADVFDGDNGRLVVGSREARVSAPPSREVPSSNGTRYSNDRITLTGLEKEAARISGVSEGEYAAQLLRLKWHKERGDYGGGQ